MTIHDLWNEYREQCCPPELDESAPVIYWQRIAFLAGVTATLGNIIMRPACFEELRLSLELWIATRDTEPRP
jgi:hypothetical protein